MQVSFPANAAFANTLRREVGAVVEHDPLTCKHIATFDSEDEDMVDALAEGNNVTLSNVVVFPSQAELAPWED